MDYATMYEALYGNLPHLKAEAQEELATMSNQDWSEWIDYRNNRLDLPTEE